jgi:hypothetical protein
VIAVVWLFDACVAPLGLLVAEATREHSAAILLLAPLVGLLVVADRDRNARIAEGQRRLGLVAHERTRLQSAVQRLGDAFAAKLDLKAVTEVLLAGSIDALDADGGRLVLRVPPATELLERSGSPELEPLLLAAGEAAQAQGGLRQLEIDDVWMLAVPLTVGPDGVGAFSVARRGRAFREDEQTLLSRLAERAQYAAVEIVAHEALREQAVTDPLTRLGKPSQARRGAGRPAGQHVGGEAAAVDAV